ncbi:hypothetical protein G6F35_016803 [Rhizopus arrhizus]|nr:hypothetical protein G6F35_016803 [Rhizopus arrhizus]
MQVVAVDTAQGQPCRGLARRPAGRGCAVEQIPGCQRRPDLAQPLGRAAIQHLPAVLPRAGSHIHQPVGTAQRVQVVLHHEQRVAGRLQLVQRAVQRLPICRMQAGRGFVQHIHHAKQVGSDLGRQPQPLQLAGREGGRGAVHRQIPQAQGLQGSDAFDEIAGDALRDDVARTVCRRPVGVPAGRRRQDLRDPGERQPG